MGSRLGYTSHAGRCLISAASNGKFDIIIVVFGSDTKNIRTTDSKTLIDYVFSSYDVIDVKSLVEQKYTEYLTYYLPYLNINKSFQSLSTYLEPYEYDIYPIKKSDNTICFASISKFNLDSPIKKDQVVGTIDLFVNNSKIFTVNIRSAEYVKRKEPTDYILYFLKNYKIFYTV